MTVDHTRIELGEWSLQLRGYVRVEGEQLPKDSYSLDLSAASLPEGGFRIAPTVTANYPVAIDTVSVAIDVGPGPFRLLADGYHSWDWTGYQQSPATGWWSALLEGPSYPDLHIHCPAPEGRAVGIALTDNILTITICGHPDQHADRTGGPQPLNLRMRKGHVWRGPIVVLEESPIASPAMFGPRPVGWMSWNALGCHVTAKAIRDILPEVIEGGTVLLDDGWAPRWGDWTEHEDFGASLEELSASIHQSGRNFGLWIAPFLVHPESRVAVEHPDWLRMRQRKPLLDRRPALAHHVLDGRLPAVQQYLRALGASLATRGVDLVKADFLYAAELPADGDTGLSGLRAGLSALASGLRATASSPIQILACGAPAPLVTGLAYSCRSGGDAVINVPTRGVKTESDTLFFHTPEILAAQQRNAHARQRLWGRALACDPDAITMGPTAGTPAIEDDEFATWLALLRDAGGPVFSSDQPWGASASRTEALHQLQDYVRRRHPATSVRYPMDDTPVFQGRHRTFYSIH